MLTRTHFFRVEQNVLLKNRHNVYIAPSDSCCIDNIKLSFKFVYPQDRLAHLSDIIEETSKWSRYRVYFYWVLSHKWEIYTTVYHQGSGTIEEDVRKGLLCKDVRAKDHGKERSVLIFFLSLLFFPFGFLWHSLYCVALGVLELTIKTSCPWTPKSTYLCLELKVGASMPSESHFSLRMWPLAGWPGSSRQPCAHAQALSGLL